MKKIKPLILTTFLTFTLIGCSNPTDKSSSTNSSSNESSFISKDDSSSSTSSEITPITKKELTIENIFNDLLEISKGDNFEVSYDYYSKNSFTKNSGKDIYTSKYIVKELENQSYFKLPSIYDDKDAIYKASFTKNNGHKTFELGTMIEGEDSEGYPTSAPASDFHTINTLSYITNPYFGISKDTLTTFSDSKIGVSKPDSSNIDKASSYLYSFLCIFGHHRKEATQNFITKITFSYDEFNNLVIDYGFTNDLLNQNVKTITIKNIGKASDSDAEDFLNNTNHISNKTLSSLNLSPINNPYMSTNTKLSYVYQGQEIPSEEFSFDASPDFVHIYSKDGKNNTYIGRKESGEAYTLGINALNQVDFDSYYTSSYMNMGFAYTDFDSTSFRYDSTSNSFKYYGINGGDSINSLNFLGFKGMDIKTMSVYLNDSSTINKVIAYSDDFLTQVGENETDIDYVAYKIEIDFVEYRNVGTPSKYETIAGQTDKISSTFSKAHDTTNSFKTVGKETFNTDNPNLVDVVETYYTSDVVLAMTKSTSLVDQNYIRNTTGVGYYQKKDEQGNILGVIKFRVTKDGTVEPRSELMSDKTIKDFNFNITASPLVFQYDEKTGIISNRDGFSVNKMQDYLPLVRTRFNNPKIDQMSDNADYDDLKIQLATSEDGTFSNNIKEITYSYGMDTGMDIFSASGSGKLTFDYGTTEKPIAIDSAILDQLPTMGTFKVPTSWETSTSPNKLGEALTKFYEGKKDRYGNPITSDTIPYLFDDDLDATWEYSIGQLSNTKDLNIAQPFSLDGDVNSYMARYAALLDKDNNFELKTFNPDGTEKGPNDLGGTSYYVNGDIFISVTAHTAGGIYFYTAAPIYTSSAE